MTTSIMNSPLFGSTTCEHSGVKLTKTNKPVRLVYETTVKHVSVGEGGYLIPVNILELKDHSGKKVRVSVEVIE